MQCPKEKQIELSDGLLDGSIPVKYCAQCEGMWLPVEHYKDWQSRQPEMKPEALPKTLDVDYTPSPLDTKGALCPECHFYLARAKVGSRNPFYVERCVNCGGIWCDRGEWEALEQMGINSIIERLFASDWQLRVKEIELAERERRATIEKLGDDLAQRIFDLAELLENHPNGDFGVAYLMRRFDQ